MPELESQHRLRNLFYDRVGLSDRILHSVGDVSEKTRLQELLNLEPIPVTRLTDFCSKYKMPDQYRHIVWKLILNQVPIFAENCKFVREQREMMYWDAWRSLLAMRLESIEWQPLEDGTVTSLFIRLNDELRSKGKVYSVGIQRQNCVVDNTDQSCSSVRFVATPDYSYDTNSRNVTEDCDKSLTSPVKSSSGDISFGNRSSNVSQLSIIPGSVTPSYVMPVASNRIQRRNSCSADVGNSNRLIKRDGIVSPLSKESFHRKSGTATTFGVIVPHKERREIKSPIKDAVVDAKEVIVNTEEDLMLDARVYGVFTLKKHYIGFTQSDTYQDSGWDMDAVQIQAEEAASSVVDNLLMWMMNRDRICYQSCTTQIVNSPAMAAYLCVGHHLNCDAIEESYGLRFAVWDLMSTNERKIIDAVMVTGRRLLGSHSGASAAVAQILESVHFFESPRLPYFALSLFSNLLSPVAAEKVMDKVIAQCFEYLGHLFVELIMQMRKNISSVRNRLDAMIVFTEIKKSDADCAVNNSLEYFHKENQSFA